jgi:hypothetical protein
MNLHGGGIKAEWLKAAKRRICNNTRAILTP